MGRAFEELENELAALVEGATEKFEVVKFYTEEIEKVLEAISDDYSGDSVLTEPVLIELFSRLRSNLDSVETYVMKAHNNLTEDILEGAE